MEVLCCYVLPGLILVAAGSTTLSAARLGRMASERWGKVPQRVRAGEGAYRAARLTRFVPRGVPWSVWVAGLTSSGGAILTGLVIGPLELLMGLAMIDTQGGIWHRVGLVTLAAGLSSLALAFGLHFAGRALLTCERDGWRLARRVAVWSGVQHLVLVGTYAVGALQPHHGWSFFVAAVFAVGLGHAGVLQLAAERTRAIHAALDPEERAALPDSHGDAGGEPRVVGLLEGLEGRARPGEARQEQDPRDAEERQDD